MKKVGNHKSFSKIFFSLAITLTISLNAFSQDAAKGKEIFNANCAACHKLDAKSTGPALRGVEAKYDKEWLYKWIKNSGELIKSGDFNYLSGDYGKAHNYIAAGLPVLGSKTNGLQYIETINAGILVNSASTKDIKNAILKIKADYENLSKNAFKASEDYDFKKNFIDNLAFLS